MKRDLRSTTLALATSGLVVLASAACSGQAMYDTVMSAESTETGAAGDGETETRTLAGKMEFVAPGELLIDGQSFFVTENTEIVGGVNTCPADEGVGEDGFGIVECDLESVETTLQAGTPVYAQVEMDENGNAASINEYARDVQDPGETDGPEDGDGEAPEESGGFTGIASGELEYVAPGEYIVDGTAFYVAEDTRITAGKYACVDGVQDPDTGDVRCDFDEFDATLANGTVILASVDMVDGIAETITEIEP
ncbi:hypothetical protein [Nocardiopsis sp. MG754419]|uniref:hypothetical protein n=1 Tax=Nocardiopsis sp. MG754419 TaxID=2259865 RepID=UPI001BA8BF4A|nr:hypothetical protein [Nocardiopsis sp. MG754419]MBR8741698.1 hypothetical protein [Nocardiopsis sp. MG754419]